MIVRATQVGGHRNDEKKSRSKPAGDELERLSPTPETSFWSLQDPQPLAPCSPSRGFLCLANWIAVAWRVINEQHKLFGHAWAIGYEAQNMVENTQYNVPEITMAAGNVNTQAMAILRTVESCNPEPFAAMVPAMPEERTWVVETGRP